MRTSNLTESPIVAILKQAIDHSDGSQSGMVCWSDALRCRRHLRTVTVIDDVNRELVHLAVDPAISAMWLVHLVAQMTRDHGLPQSIRDSGPEFLGDAFVPWAQRHSSELRDSQGKNQTRGR